MKNGHATMNWLWRGARRTAREHPGQSVEAEYISQPFELHGRRVQVTLTVVIDPVAKTEE